MATSSKPTSVFLLLLCILFSIVSTLPERNAHLLCNEIEKHALLTFKHAILTLQQALHPLNALSSWSAQKDCCQWNGVYCHNVTGRVLRLDLNNCSLDGKVSPALLQLEFLNNLDLSYNDFGGSPIPSFLGSMRSLNYLDLSYASFGGLIPPQLGNLSNLQTLSLGGSAISDYSAPFYAENLKWITHLSSLKYLYMYGVDLHSAVDWLESINMLSSLSMLELDYCNLDNMNPSLQSVNFTSLVILHLPWNHFNHELPHWVFNLTSLCYLYLSNNQLIGQIPENVGQLRYLEYFGLDYNSLDGPFPLSIGNLSSLSDLRLSGNRLNGTLPSSLWHLSNLEVLWIGNNSFVGIISEVHFSRLSKLKSLDISYSPSLVFKVDSNWVPSFQLNYMWMGYCHVGPSFPMWLQTQSSIGILHISNSGIVDSAPSWFWKWASYIDDMLYLDNNRISGNLSGIVLKSSYIDLSSNCFEGQLPRFSPHVVELKMANNSFSGSISPFLCSQLNGETNLQLLDISNNHLSGKLPHCWKYWPSLTHLNLGNNNFWGKIPDSMGTLSGLEVLHLHNNDLCGDIPPSLSKSISLGLLDLGGNKFSGNIPSWLGKSTKLMVLILRSNKLVGVIPLEICQLSSLIVLDLAQNNLSGTIPKCFNHFISMTTMTTKHNEVFSTLEYSYNVPIYESVMLVMKGRLLEYNSILKHVRTIDLSNNNLSGLIPDEISSLSTLQSLNLYFNHLTGRIPEKIGTMIFLECLDLSRNHLFSEIPQSMKNLTFLHNLDLSYNNFSGRIPLSTQLQSFDALCYIGNVELCGAPLANNCTKDAELKDPGNINEKEAGSTEQCFYIGIVFGFVVGFWGVCGPLILKRSWRYAYFQFVYHVMGMVYLAIQTKWRKLWNILRMGNNNTN